jgi:hypothetical protein
MDVNLTVEKLFHLLLEWFRSQRDAKVKEYSQPELIKVRAGPLVLPHEVKVNLKPEKTGMTRIVFSFDFSKVYAATLVISAIGLILTGIFFGLDAVAFCLIPLTAAFFSIQRDTRKAKWKFMRELRRFLRKNNVVCLYAD